MRADRGADGRVTTPGGVDTDDGADGDRAGAGDVASMPTARSVARWAAAQPQLMALATASLSECVW